MKTGMKRTLPAVMAYPRVTSMIRPQVIANKMAKHLYLCLILKIISTSKLTWRRKWHSLY
jgi:hypothetical protein